MHYFRPQFSFPPQATWDHRTLHRTRRIHICVTVVGHMGARTAPPPPLECMEYGSAWGPMTRGALPPGVFFPLEPGALGSCMGLEGTWGPVLHPFPLSHRQLPFLTHARLWLLRGVQPPYAPLPPTPIGPTTRSHKFDHSDHDNVLEFAEDKGAKALSSSSSSAPTTAAFLCASEILTPC